MNELYEAAIGQRNKNYYLARVEEFEKKRPMLETGWNWSAFLFGSLWALYRKMYVAFAILFTVALLAIFVAPAEMKPVILGGQQLFFAVFANAIYRKHITQKVESVKKHTGDNAKRISILSKNGGVHYIAMRYLYPDDWRRR